MTRLSLAMIVKNEEETLGRILACARSFCDELVVVDTGSTDKTVEIAKKAGAKVFHYTWNDNFADARNYAFDCCKGDWLIWLDADDYIPESEQAKILEIKKTLLTDQLDVVCLTYQSHFNEANECELSFYRERLVRRAAGLRWESPVHECLSFDYARALIREDVNIEHRSPATKVRGDRNIRILEKAYGEGNHSLRILFYYGNELKDHQRYDEAIPVYREYLEKGPDNWEKYTAFIHLATCYQHAGMERESLLTFQQALLFNSARAEAFNHIGIYYYNRSKWQEAVPYFAAATEIPRPANQGFIYDAHYTWMPYHYLAYCYCYLGPHDKAFHFAQKALRLHPDKQQVLPCLNWIIDQIDGGQGETSPGGSP